VHWCGRAILTISIRSDSLPNYAGDTWTRSGVWQGGIRIPMLRSSYCIAHVSLALEGVMPANDKRRSTEADKVY
jgi:hypothetical protein